MKITFEFDELVISKVFKALEITTNLEIMEPGEEDGIPVSRPRKVSAEEMFRALLERAIKTTIESVLNEGALNPLTAEASTLKAANREAAETALKKGKEEEGKDETK
jgi:hypothetical protein